MPKFLSALIALLLSTAFAPIRGLASSEGCFDLGEDFNSQSTLDGRWRVYHRLSEVGCGEIAERARSWLLEHTWPLLQELENDDPERRKLIEDLADTGAHAPALIESARLHFADKRFELAADRSEQAVRRLQQEFPVPDVAQSTAMVQMGVLNMQARTLAADIDERRQRGIGLDLSGPAALYFRQAPIEFVQGRTTFTKKGLKAAKELAQTMRYTTPAVGEEIFLVGHADTVGSAAWNCELSRARATAVRQFLIESLGAQARQIRVLAAGEAIAPESSGMEGTLSRGQLDQLDRRVQFELRPPSAEDSELCNPPRERTRR